MTVGQISLKILPLLLLFCMNYPPITCQNCGLPTTIRVSEQLAESLDTGQEILPPIPAYNVVNAKITHNPGNFASINFIPATESSNAKFSLTVGTPLWPRPYPYISYIDETRAQELKVDVELECSDGRKKEICIYIPIVDENTEVPHYEQTHYELTTEPCMLERCALIFETDKEIKVIDKDRDEKNAKVQLWTSVPNMVNFLHGYSNFEPWYDDGYVGSRTPKGYQSRVRLEYVPENMNTWQKSINFTIYVNNTERHSNNDNVFVASSTVTINFEENPHRTLAPIFTSPLYYAFVEYEGEQVYTQPANIYASVPGHEHNKSDIQYVIEGQPDVFRIDCTGNLSFIKDIGVMGGFRHTRIDYNVTAERKTATGIPVVSSKVPLIVFFGNHDDSECESTTPWPGTCPAPTCPEPEPCPGTPITEPPIEPSYPDPTTKMPPGLTTESTEYTTETSESSSTTELPPELTTENTEYTTESSEQSSTTESTELPPEFTDLPPTTTDLIDPDPSTTISPGPSTTVIPPTIPPGKCTCNCTDFTCADPQVPPSLNSTLHQYYADPYDCTLYHRCGKTENGPMNEGEDDKLTFKCPPDTVFCPAMTACTTVEMCIIRSFDESFIKGGYGGGSGGGGDEEEECQECRCRNGLLPGHPANVCTEENYESLIPDGSFFDVFHQCQPWQKANQSSFIDYPRQCPPGLVFCPNKSACGYHDDPDCFRETYSMIFKQCDVCIMGKWDNFDIFSKSFL